MKHPKLQVFEPDYANGKGIFIRGLIHVSVAEPGNPFAALIKQNASAVWCNRPDKDTNQFAYNWNGVAGYEPTKLRVSGQRVASALQSSYAGCRPGRPQRRDVDRAQRANSRQLDQHQFSMRRSASTACDSCDLIDRSVVATIRAGTPQRGNPLSRQQPRYLQLPAPMARNAFSVPLPFPPAFAIGTQPRPTRCE